MLDVSGYGLLKDNWSNNIVDYDDYTNKREEVGSIRYIINMINILQQNMKSKYIVSSSNDDPILESKSLSLFTKSLSELTNIYNKNMDNYVSKDNPEKLNDEFVFDLYNNYNYREMNSNPIRNYDLLDQNGKLPINFLDKSYNEIFYDKLIINCDRMDIFKTIGPLYNLSLSNIPVLNKLYKFNINNLEIKYKIDFEKINPLIKVLHIARTSSTESNDNESKIIRVLFKVKSHFKTIKTTYMENKNVYIPTLLMWFNLETKLKGFIENSYPINSISNTDTGLAIIRDFDFYAFKVFNAYKNLNHIDKNSHSTIEYSTINLNSFKDKIKSKFFKRDIIPWPFGNVYDNCHICMNITNNTINKLYCTPLKNNVCSINLTNIINGIYSDFIDSKFNTDLRNSDFFLKDTYEEYLTLKEYFMDKENGFKEFIDTLENYRKEIVKTLDNKRVTKR